MAGWLESEKSKTNSEKCFFSENNGFAADIPTNKPKTTD
jgi:hypothetical protein